jgi:AcrR family transcriptional regulator
VSPTDRPTALRAATCRLVARHGFHGTSMGALAKEAGVAVGTAYVHYASKDELVLAAYADVKRALGEVATAAVDPDASPRVRFEQLWRAAHRHLSEDPDRARFLLQVEVSPFAEAAHDAVAARDADLLLAAAEAPDMAALLAPLPPRVLFDLALGPAVRLAAGPERVDRPGLAALVEACWRAITRP